MGHGAHHAGGASGSFVPTVCLPRWNQRPQTGYFDNWGRPIPPSAPSPAQCNHQNPVLPYGLAEAMGQHTHHPLSHQSDYACLGPGYRPPRLYALHYCGWDRCCYKLSGEGDLHAHSIEHLPVCHPECWKSELRRLGREGEGWRNGALPTCHRVCFMKGLYRLRYPGLPEKESVPKNRTMGEWVRVPKLRHWMEKRAGRM